MRIAFAGFHIESVSFLETLSTRAMFEEQTSRGADIITTYRGTNTVPGGVIAKCEEFGFEIVPIVYAFQGAVGPATDEAVESYAAEIADALRDMDEPLDGVILHLHGAAVSPNHRDVEAYYIDRVREVIGPSLPLVVGFDYHGNLSAASVRKLSAAVAYRKSPHTDMGETGRRAGHWFKRIAVDGAPVAVAIAKPGIVIPSIFSATSLPVLAGILKNAEDIQEQHHGEVDISVMAGFAYGDTEDTGFSILVTGSLAKADLDAVAESLSRQVWDARKDLLNAVPLFSAEAAVVHATARAGKAARPYVLLEHADRMNDSTYVLAELIRQNVRKAAVPLLWDADAARAAHRAGAGAEIDLEIGAWSSRRAGPRLQVRCKVLQSGEKSYRVSGPVMTGHPVDLGVTALIDIDGISVSLTSQFGFAIDEDAFTIFGLDARDFDIIVLRSKTHFRAVYEPLAEEILIVDTPDWGTSDLRFLPYEHLDRGAVYPLSG